MKNLLNAARAASLKNALNSSALSKLKKEELIKLVTASKEAIKIDPTTASSIVKGLTIGMERIQAFTNAVTKIALVAALIKLIRKYTFLRRIFLAVHICIGLLYFIYHFTVFGWNAFDVMWLEIVAYLHGIIAAISNWPVIAWLGSLIASFTSFSIGATVPSKVPTKTSKVSTVDTTVQRDKELKEFLKNQHSLCLK